MGRHCGGKEDIKAVMLAGSRDFGHYCIASRYPVVLWLVAGKSVLGRLLSHLARGGIKPAVVCYNGDCSLMARSINAVHHL